MELWKTKIPSKIVVFAWRLCRGRLPTKENLRKRNIQINNCIKIQPIWWESMSWMNIKGAKRWRYWWLAVTWSIWKLRNKILFANAEFDTNRLFEDAIFIVWTWLRQFEKDFTIHYNQWSSNIRQGFLFM